MVGPGLLLRKNPECIDRTPNSPLRCLLMRVLLFSTTHYALDDRIFYREAASLSRAGHQVMVMAKGVGEAVAKGGIELLPLPGSPSGPVLQARAIMKEVDDLRPQIVHCHEPESLPTALRIRRRMGSLLVYDVHEDQLALAKVHSSTSPWKRLAMARTLAYERSLCPRVDHLLAATASLARRYSAWGRPVTAVYNYPRTDIFRPTSDRGLERVYRDRDVIVYAGALTRWRLVPVMVDAVRAVASSEPQVLLLIMSHHPPAWVGAVGETRNQWVEYVGWVDHTRLPAYHSMAMAGLSLLEPCPPMEVAAPTKMFEYMACGIPPVVTSLPETERVLHGRRAGILLHTVGPQELKAALLRLLGDRREMEALGGRALRAVRRRYNWSFAEKALLEVYEDLGSRLRGRAA
jgi:glycosyltransferase involved in cell wall biosynthesis